MGIMIAIIMIIIIMGIMDENMLDIWSVCWGYNPPTVPYWYCWGLICCPANC